MSAELEKVMPDLIAAWAKATHQPMPPDGRYRYSFTNFYDWLKRSRPSYTVFRAALDPRYEIETYFRRILEDPPRK
jgi:hypothetical protein